MAMVVSFRVVLGWPGRYRPWRHPGGNPPADQANRHHPKRMKIGILTSCWTRPTVRAEGMRSIGPLVCVHLAWLRRRWLATAPDRYRGWLAAIEVNEPGVRCPFRVDGFGRFPRAWDACR